MKYLLYCIGIVFLYYADIQIARAQIGINTEYPKTVFHIDAARDNPADGVTALSPLQQSNDIVVDNSGNLGVGTITPLTKLHVENDPSITGTSAALRLSPGIGLPSILWLSNDAKTVEWKQNPSLGVLGTFEFVMQSFPYANTNWASLIKRSGVMNLETNGVPGSTDYYRIRIPSAGRYMVTINIMGTNTSPSASLTQSLYVLLGKNDNLPSGLSFYDYYEQMGNNLADAVEYYQATLSMAKRTHPFTVSLYAGYCTPADYLVIRLMSSIAYLDGAFATIAANPITVTVYNI